MKEYPILFSGPMVCAIRQVRKTQTRRVLKPQPVMWDEGLAWKDEPKPLADLEREMIAGCPYGQPGDLLWVKETFAKRYADAERDPVDGIIYRADGGYVIEPRWTPAIYMPRWASRLTLHITDMRVQRLQDITEDDAIAEGIYDFPPDRTAVGLFSELWDGINAKRGCYSWAFNPWVWAITFEPPENAGRAE